MVGLEKAETRIIGTIGPASIGTDTLKRLQIAGLQSFRINLSHSSKESLGLYYSRLAELNIRPSIDTQGAQVRIIWIREKCFNQLNEKITIACVGNSEVIDYEDFDICLNHKELFDQIEQGDTLKIGFDGLIVKVVECHGDKASVTAEVINIGRVSVNKALDICGKVIKLQPFTEFDVSCILNSFKHNIKEIYVSFCDSRETIDHLKTLLYESGWTDKNMPLIIAKIESRRGLLNLNEIIKSADGILVDRGDLSREMRISTVPHVVASIIQRCNSFGIPCYVATNVLDSMMVEALPSRAEISDMYHLLSSERADLFWLQKSLSESILLNLCKL